MQVRSAGALAGLLLVVACSSSSPPATTSANDAGAGDAGPPVYVAPGISDVTCATSATGSTDAAGVAVTCACQVTERVTPTAGTTAEYSGDPCGESQAADPYCCADASYPNDGSCSCAHASGGAWACSGMQSDDGRCSCSFGGTSTGTPTAVCNTAWSSGLTVDGGTPTPQCYQSSVTPESCYCRVTPPAPGDTPVATCDPSFGGGAYCAQNEGDCSCGAYGCRTSAGVCSCFIDNTLTAGTAGDCSLPDQTCCLDPEGGNCACAANLTCAPLTEVSVADCKLTTIAPLLQTTAYGTTVSSCTGKAGPGTPSICCASATGCSCANKGAGEMACGSGETEVTDCSTAALAGVAPERSACPAGQHKIDSCSVNLTVVYTPPPVTTTAPPDSGTKTPVQTGCDPEECVDGTGCYCSGALNSPSSKCICPVP